MELKIAVSQSNKEGSVFIQQQTGTWKVIVGAQKRWCYIIHSFYDARSRRNVVNLDNDGKKGRRQKLCGFFLKEADQILRFL